MRPLYIKMSAFGPFSGHEEVDFRQFGQHAMFLINGPTGAGKTTILDAICFALYGETTGNERQGRDMRCDFAEASTLTEVELLFQLAQRHYKIRRVPEQARPKARGEGVTQQTAEAQLWEIDEEGGETLIVPRKVGEANARIVELTGLSAEQFRQVMVLPQGKFRDLLLADSQDREQIFCQLFQTQIYIRLEEELKHKAHLLSQEVKALQLQQDALLSAVAMEDSNALVQRITQLEDEIKQTKSAKELAEKAHIEAITQLEKAKQLDEQFQALEQARMQLKVLEEEGAEIEHKRKKLSQADSAEKINSVFQSYQASCRDYGEIKQDADAAKKALSAAEKELKTSEKTRWLAQDQKPKLEALVKERHVLNGYVEKTVQLEQTRKAFQQIELALRTSKKDYEQHEQRLNLLREQVKTLRAENDALQEKASSIIDIHQKLERLKQKTTMVRERDVYVGALAKYAEEVRDAEEKVALCEGEFAKAVAKRQRLQTAYRNNQAAILADTLEPDSPCPVCGATDHPQPAQSQDVVPTEEEINNIQEQSDRCTSAINAAKQHLAGLLAEKKFNETKLAEINAQLKHDGLKPLQRLLEEQEDLSRQFNVLQQGQARQKQIQEELKKRLEEERIEQQNGVSLEEQFKSNDIQLAATRELITDKEEGIPAEFRNAETLNSAIAELVRNHGEILKRVEEADINYQQTREHYASADTALTKTKEQLEKAEQRHLEVCAAWQEVLDKSPFETESEFQKALLNEEVRAELKNALRDYEDRRLKVQQNVDEYTQKLNHHMRPNIAQCQDAEHKTKLEATRCREQYHSRVSHLGQLKDAEKKIQACVAQQKKQEEAYSTVGTLAQLANGKNDYNLSLHRFVLSVLLDDVLLEAAYRLQKMSKGRYQLLRRENVADGRKKSGLDLEVADAYTGKQRPVATLSGGESFMAALSLALGLSDVVQAYAGGIRLDMLFVDEGFGSLDPESLDLALDVLTELRASGRLIGVISHVPELKARMDARLDLKMDRQGTHIELVV